MKRQAVGQLGEFRPSLVGSATGWGRVGANDALLSDVALTTLGTARELNAGPTRANVMGYDVHITRAEDWTESEEHPIALAEWLDYVRADTEMRLDGQATAATALGDRIVYENEGLSVWQNYSLDGVDGNHAWFDYFEGRIMVKNPDEEILAKMMRIADHLGARVLGDDGEPYTVGSSEVDGRERSWWQRLFGRRFS